MRKFLLLTMLFLISSMSNAQTEKMPTIMVLPSDHWCSMRYFTRVIENQGKKVTINDYETAFREDSELSSVVSKIGEIMIKSGYPVKDYMQEFKSIMDDNAEDEVTMSSMGAMIEETPLDMLRRRVKYDIELRVDWNVNKEGEGHSISLNLTAIDTYSNKQVASTNGTGKEKDKIIPKLIDAALQKQMKLFTKQLNTHFADILKNGREITVQIKTWDSGEYTLETENAEGVELIDVINEWFGKNTVNGVFSLSNNTDTRAKFEQVRIPMYNEKGRAMDARMFINKLRQFLKKEEGIESKIMNKGLGEVTLIIGEK